MLPLRDRIAELAEVKPKEEVVETKPEVETSTSPATEEVTTAGATTEDTETPAYVPNTKFTVLSWDEKARAETKIEKDFEEWVKPFLTKDTEEKFRDLYSKAEGLNYVKQTRAQERAAKEDVERQFSAFKNEIQDIVSTRDVDLGLFFEKLRLPKQKIAEWLVQELQKEELPENQRKVYTEHEALRRENFELRKKADTLSSTMIDPGVQARTLELQGVLSNPEIKALAESFDTRLEKPGAFIDMVIHQGKMEWEATRRDLSVQEAVDRVLRIAGLTQTPSTGVTPNEPAKPAATKVITQAKPTVIPNVGAGNSSPSSARPKNLDDLRRLAKAAQAA